MPSLCYLWHWPILIYAMYSLGTTQLGLIPGSAVILVAVALSWSTYRFIETPLRAQGKRLSTAAAGFGRVGALAPTLACGALAVALSVPVVANYYRLNGEVDEFIAANRDNRHLLASEHRAEPLVMQLMGSRRLLPESTADGCNVAMLDAAIKVCMYGKRDGKFTVALIGGSHAQQWLPALQWIAEDRGIRIANLTKDGCRLGGESRTCKEWNAGLARKVAEIGPDIIFTTATVDMRNVLDRLPNSYPRIWHKFTSGGARVVAIRDNPRPAQDGPDCVAREIASPASCGELRSRALAAVNPTRGRDLGPHVSTIDMTDAFCDNSWCPYVRGGYLIYRDNSHISVPYARFLAPELEARLDGLGALPARPAS